MSIKPIFISILSLMAATISAWAIPADPRPKQFIQPNGETITVQICGDERGHFYLTTDDYLLVRREDAFYYGNVDTQGAIINSGLIARPVSKRTQAEMAYLKDVDMPRVLEALHNAQTKSPMAKSVALAPDDRSGLMTGANYPLTGSPKSLVVLVEYQDVKFTLEDPHDYFTRMLNEEGFSDYNATGSVLDYLRDNSMGFFTPEFDVYGPLTLEHDMEYYGGNDLWGNDKKAYEMVIEACHQLDDTIDFNDYDANGDGEIDNVYIYYAGKGEASGGSSNTVWPHSWDLNSAGVAPKYFDGVSLMRYACSNEWEGNTPDGIGTFTHEFSHVLGIPDLYATSYSGAFTPGAWSVMDRGSYNNDARTPPNYSAYERYSLGWLEPTELECPSDCELPHIAQNKAFIINTDKKKEYFLIENRQKEGWDSHIPGHGMLLWHVDFVQDKWDMNTVNNSSSHQHVDIIEADYKRDEGSRNGDSFPGASRVTSINEDTRPSLSTWSGASLGISIDEITEKDGMIAFRVSPYNHDVHPVSLYEATNIMCDGFTLSWDPDDNATKYLVSIYTKCENEGNEEIAYVNGWNKRNVGKRTEITVEELLPETLYSCVVYAANKENISEGSNIVSVTTTALTFDRLFPTALEATDIKPHEFIANWEELEGATDYLLNVYVNGESKSNCESCDFTGGVYGLPEGWSTSATLTYSNEEYCGVAPPALRMSKDNTYITSPEMPDDITGISFWLRGIETSSSNTLRVYGMIEDTYRLIKELDITDDPGTTISIDIIEPLTRAIKIEYHVIEQQGAIALDDIQIVWGEAESRETLSGYSALNVGNTNQYTIDGLQASTTYYYTVAAFDGEKTSRESREIMVTTADEAGITDATIAPLIYANGHTLYIKTDESKEIAIYNPMGCLIRIITTQPGITSVDDLPTGLYLIGTTKIAIR